MRLSKALISKIENAGFSVSHEDGNDYYFRKCSTAGQDFGFSIDTGEDIAEFAKNVLRYYEDFDVSYEAYLWLDENGHGTNGAPYDMRDLYNDMEECEGFISELYDLLMEEDD
jgi:hypothetical protein